MDNVKNHVHKVGSVMMKLLLVKNVMIPVELALVLQLMNVPLVKSHYINLEILVFLNVLLDIGPLTVVPALIIMIVVVVKLVMLSVKLVTDHLMKNVLFVKLVIMLNQILTNNVKAPVLKDFMLILLLELVFLVNTHVPHVLLLELMETVLGVLKNMPLKVDIVITLAMMDISTMKVSVLHVTLNV